MAPGSFRFEHFSLDPNDRQLRRDDAPVELNARYLDALILLVREQGRLVSKDRFLEEVWRGVPVTDEALTQCIRTLRKQLGDDTANPRFIETSPKHGYRFIAQVQWIDREGEQQTQRTAGALPDYSWRQVIRLSAAGAIGGAGAGLCGGLFYGAVGAYQSLEPGMGGASALLVLVCLTMLVALIGGAGVGLGIAVSGLAPARLGQWSVVGGALGGLIVGGVVKLIGIDAFDLLFGQSPGEITGAPEGALLGGAVGLGVWLADRADSRSLPLNVALASLAGATAGVLIHLLGGRLMAGSLDLLASRFPGSRLHLDQIGRLFGESDFGPISQAVTGGLEGALFGGAVVGAMILARRSLSASA